MSLYGMMRTGVSGMAAQASRLSTVADNIANSGTTGYKRSKTEFSSLLVPSTKGAYNSGGVTATVQTSISAQGVLQYTTSGSDLAVDGNGFFIVQDASGQPFLTRAGSFIPDDQGNLVNAAGFKLLGYSFAGGTPTTTANGFAGLEPVSVVQQGLTATPTTTGSLLANLPENAATGDAFKKSVAVFDKAGEVVLVDFTFTKTAANEWEITSPDATAPVTVTFDPATDQMTATSALTLALPDNQTINFDMSLSQYASDFTVEAERDGSAPNAIESVEIDTDGTLYAQYADGSYKALYRIPLADVPSPDQLTVLSGNVYAESANSGGVQIGFPGDADLGSVVSGALESSNVDIAEELTNMIQAQRSYTANSKVFQTGADLMDILVNLKR
jgi:flagellar hook protein FlgE